MPSPRSNFLALPLVLIALLLQLGAPANAARMAAAMADPFAAVVICSPDKDKAVGQDGRQDQDRHANHDCGLCTVCTPMTGGPAVLAQVVAPYPPGAVPPRPVLAAQASPRGPPLGRPNARAPPLQA